LLAAARQDISAVRIEPTLRPYIVTLVRRTRDCRHFRLALARVPRSVCFSLREPWLASKAAIPHS